jgi:hypothetical protein
MPAFTRASCLRGTALAKARVPVRADGVERRDENKETGLKRLISFALTLVTMSTAYAGIVLNDGYDLAFKLMRGGHD